jgi:ELP3 family radical SAM enzyme/protein acetyltransferase
MYNSKFALNYTSEDIENIFNKEHFKIHFTEKDFDMLKETFKKAQNVVFKSSSDYIKFMNKETHNCFSKIKLIKAYRILLQKNQIEHNLNLEQFMKFKATRGNSGILQITTMMSGELFGVESEENIKNGGCPHKCIYCCLEKIDGVITQPKSYRTEEPANKRATQNKHHPVGQVFDRLNTFEKMGHLSPVPENPAKIEFMISGGTFNFYEKDYIIWFTTMSYYALNVYYDYTLTGTMREPLSLETEQKLNESSHIRMIGLTIETRPDYLDTEEVKIFRELGVTRVQTGTQHTEDMILKKVKRDCTDKKNQEGNKILMQNGVKVDNHWMLDLYGSSPEIDMKMIDQIFAEPNYAVDQIKIYPTMVIEYSELYDMYQSGEYKPYAEQNDGKDLKNVIIHFLEKVPYYIRVNRVIRDFFAEAIVGGVKDGNLRKSIEDEFRMTGKILKDIRYREIKSGEFDESDCFLFIEKYDACDGTNYFISYENKSRTKLYGFIRLRFNISEKYTISELIGHALIRELHVYGVHTGVGNASDKKTQHRGLGKKLLAKAEEIASLNGYENITVISGVGVKEYYRKQGYTDYHTYMTKQIEMPMKYHYISFSFAIMFIMIFVFIFFI